MINLFCNEDKPEGFDVFEKRKKYIYLILVGMIRIRIIKNKWCHFSWNNPPIFSVKLKLKHDFYVFNVKHWEYVFFCQSNTMKVAFQAMH